jgi:hypothetical protein
MDLVTCEHCGGQHHPLDGYCDETGIPLFRIRCEPRVIDFGILSWADAPLTKLLSIRIDGQGAASGDIRLMGDVPWLEVSPTRFELVQVRAAEVAVTCYPERLQAGTEQAASVIVEFAEPPGLDEAAGVTNYATQVRATRKPAPRLVVEPDSVDFQLQSDEPVTQSLRMINIGQDLLDGRVEISRGMRTWLRIEPPTPFRLAPGESHVYRITTSRGMIGGTREIMGKMLIIANDPDTPRRLAEVKANTQPAPARAQAPKEPKPRPPRPSSDVLIIDLDDLGPQDEESKRKRREPGG